MIILLAHLYTPQPQLKQLCFLGLECVSVNQELVDATYYNKVSVKPRWAKNRTILPEVLDFLFMNKVYVESWSSTSVTQSVLAATTTL